MTQRLSYNYDYNLEREKVSKMNEIQNYVSILMENNKSYAYELNLLRKENTDLRGQIQAMMGEMLKVKENYEDSLAQTKVNYSQEIGALIDQLKDILNRKQQMQGSYKSLLQELSYQSQFDKTNRMIQINELQRNYDNKIKILNDRIQQQNKQLESTFYLNSDSKIKMVKQIDNLRFQIGQLKKENNDLEQARMFQQSEINRLSVNIKMTSKEKEEMGVNLLKMEQDKNQVIIELRQSSALLRQQINDHIDNLNQLELSLITKEKQYQNLTERFQHGERQKIQYEDRYHKLSIEIGQKQEEFSTVKLQFNKLNEYTSKQIKRMNDLIKILQSDNTRLSHQKQQLSSLHFEKQQQIYTLLEKIETIERQFEMTNNQLIKIQQSSLELSNHNDLLKEELEISRLQQKKYGEKCILQANHIETLQKILDKEKKRNGYLESNTDRELVYSKQMSFENQIHQRYQFELQTILKQKNDLVYKFQNQKQRLTRIYEKALHQKELLFKDKINFLENQIHQLSK